MLWSLILVAILVAAVAYIVLTVRRARREHQARSEERAAAMLLALHGAQAQPRVETTTVGPVTITTATVTAAARVENEAEASAAPSPLVALRRARLLTDPQRLLYLVLRAALPDHVVMANMRMIDLLDVPAGPEAVERDPRLSALLHQRLDCVVCSNDLTPLAALVVYTAAMPGAELEQAKADALRELGIRFLRFRADSLPRPAEMRAVVLG
jgi:cytochrome c-type biogenesis protein CcmH/NrfF